MASERRLVNVGASSGEYWVYLDQLKPLLHDQGLRIVTAEEWMTVQAAREAGAIIVSAAGKAVLDEMAAIPRSALDRWVSRSFRTVLSLAKAELARREVNNGK